MAPLWIVFALSLITTQGILSRFRVARILRKEATTIRNGSDIVKSATVAESHVDKISPTVSLGSMSDESGNSSEGDSPVDKFMDENVLVPGLEGINFPGSEDTNKDQAESESEDEVVIDSKCISSSHLTLGYGKVALGSCESLIVAPASSTFNVQPGTKIAKAYEPLELLPSQRTIVRDMNKISWRKVILVLDSLNAHGSIVVREKRFDSSEARAGIRHFVHAVNI